MKKKTLIKHLNKKFKLDKSLRHDPVGWQKIKGPSKVNKILICLDITSKVAETAIEKKVDLILHHHPFCFNGFKQTQKINYKNKLLQQFQTSNIGLFALHTNYDFHQLGLNAQILKSLGFQKINNDFHPHLFQGHYNKPLMLKAFIEKLKKFFNVENIMSTNLPDAIDQINICTGSGGFLLKNLKDQPGVFLTGDLKWNEWLYAVENNIPVIAVGHHMEDLFTVYLGKYLHKIWPDLDIIKCNTPNPIRFL